MCIDLGSYVHELNTNYSLYTALKAAIPSSSLSASQPTGTTTTAASFSSSFSSSGSSIDQFGKMQTTNTDNTVNEETLLVGQMLLRDFERYGVHLSGTAQDQMTHLVSTTQALGFAFTQNIIDPGRCGQLKIPAAAAAAKNSEGLREAVERLPYELRRLFRPWRQQRYEEESRNADDNLSGSIHGLVMSGTSSSLSSVISHSDDELLRKEAYSVYCTSPQENLKILDQLVNARHEMAALMGFDSYAAYQLDNFSLAATPYAVETFLKELASAVKPAAEREALKLAEIKRKHNGSSSKFSSSSSSLLLEPWDRDWAILKATRGGPSEQLARHFGQHVTLDGCLAGLSLLLVKTLNIKVIEESISPVEVISSGGMGLGGEIWAPGVRKLRVLDCTTGAFLGIVYLDLYKRENKFPGAAHFTLRCGKRKRRERRFAGANADMSSHYTNAFKKEDLLDADDDYQTPVVALVANFRSGGSGGSGGGHASSNPNLTFQEVETFFHEFGHALNSLLSKTEYQHLSGTRGPQDVIEIPSHVFERFSLDYETIKMLVQLSHNGNSFSSTTGDLAISKEVEKIAEMLASAAVGSKQSFAALTLQSTLSLCAIDQLLHGKNPPVGNDAERQIAAIMHTYNSIYEHHGEGGGGGGGGGNVHHHRLHPHIRFNHLVGYGSNYYCYLFAQCISSSLWEKEENYKTTAMPGEAGSSNLNSLSSQWPDGSVLRRQLLQPGGAKVAHQYVNDLFISTANDDRSSDTQLEKIHDPNPNNINSGILVAVKSPKGGTPPPNGNVGWYPKFDSLLRHLGL